MIPELLVGLVLAFREPATVPNGAKIYVRGDKVRPFMDAAFRAKHVPLVLVSSAESADFILEATPAAGAQIPRLLDVVQIESVAFRLLDKSGNVTWAYSATKARGLQSLSEACAKHLKEVVIRQKKSESK